MGDSFILYQNGFYSLPNEVACCSRLTGDSLKLLGLIMNWVNTKKPKLPTEFTISRLFLKYIFGNSVDKTVKNYADVLKRYGFIEAFSMQGGDRGEFVFGIANRPENNPYVLLNRIENEVISLTKLRAGHKADNLLKSFMSAVRAVEQHYIARLNKAAENEREGILTDYRDYLRESLQTNGNVTISATQTKQKTKKSKPEPLAETALPENVEQWSNTEFECHFLKEYQRVMGKKHSKRSRAGKTVADCIEELERHYRNHLRAERKPMMKKHIEAFFVNFPSPTFDPKAFLMADCDALYNVQRFLETGNKHIPYEQSFKNKKGKSRAELQAQQAREAQQEYMGISDDDFIASLKRRASGH